MLDRHLNLIQLFLKNIDTYLNAQDISKYLNVSNRTIRNDIKYLNSEFLPNVIVSVKSKGYSLNTETYTLDFIENEVSQLLHHHQQTIINIGYELFMTSQTLTLNHLETRYQLTRNELIDYLTRIKYWSEKFNINLSIKKRKGIDISGSDQNISNAILHLNQLTTGDIEVEHLILNEIPKAHRKVISRIIQSTLKSFNIEASDIQIKQLMIHLILIMKRNMTTTDIDLSDNESHAIAYDIMTKINRDLGYRFNEHLISYFAFLIGYHFNKLDMGLQQLFVQSYIDRLIDLMQDRIGIRFNHDHILKANLYTHFSKTYLRITQNVYLNNPLASDIKKLYPFIFNVLYEVIHKLSNDTEIYLNEDEIAFLTIHFQAAVERITKHQINIVIACYYGIGISNLLEVKIKEIDPNLNIIDTIKLENIQNYNFDNIDLLVSTHPIQHAQLPKSLTVMEVSPLLSLEDTHKITNFLKRQQNPVLPKNRLSGINFIVVPEDVSITHIVQVFEKAQDILTTKKAILSDYINSALEREKLSSTYIGHHIAIPHGNPDKVLESHVIIFRNKDAFSWKQHDVKLVFFLAIAAEDVELTKYLMKTISQFNEATVNALCQLNDQELKHQILTRFNE